MGSILSKPDTSSGDTRMPIYSVQGFAFVIALAAGFAPLGDLARRVVIACAVVVFFLAGWNSPIKPSPLPVSEPKPFIGLHELTPGIDPYIEQVVY